MQFQVPQFIETEDKIVGPLSLRQFVYLGAAAGLSFILFFILKFGFWIIITTALAGIGSALAFIRVGGRSMISVFLSAVKFLWQPQIYVWQPEKPQLKKEEGVELSSRRPGFSLENLIEGLALKNAWRKLQTKSRPVGAGREEPARNIKERFQIFERISGERRAARRVDYR